MRDGLGWVKRAQLLPHEEQRRLAALAQGGDRAAAEMLVLSISRAVLSEANKIGRRDAEDLFQVGISGALKAIVDSYDTTRPESVLVYAMATARGLMLNEAKVKRQQATRFLTLESAKPRHLRDDGVSDRLDDMERAQVFAVVDKQARQVFSEISEQFSNKQARIARLVLFRKEPMTTGELARREKMSESGVRTAVREVVKTLRVEMQRRGLLDDLA